MIEDKNREKYIENGFLNYQKTTYKASSGHTHSLREIDIYCLPKIE